MGAGMGKGVERAREVAAGERSSTQAASDAGGLSHRHHCKANEGLHLRLCIPDAGEHNLFVARRV